MNVRDSRALLIARLEKGAALGEACGEKLASSPACQDPLADEPHTRETETVVAAQTARKTQHVA